MINKKIENRNLNKILTADLDDLNTYINDLMSTIPQPVYMVNPAGVIIDANHALAAISGFSIDNMLGMKHCDLFADIDIAARADREIVKKGYIKDRELLLNTSRGKKVPVCMYSRTRSGKPGKSSYVVVLVDISERKKAEERARRNTGKLLKAMENTILAMVAVVEMRDPYTAGHQRRVAKLACAVAKDMGFSTESINGLRLSCLIHDIGKIRIPTEILTNPNRLSQAEFEMIKTHSLAGYEILKGIKLQWPIAEIVLQHHEREDGSGYPYGLTGENILLEAKILAVADVVEAMASHRPYRPALGIKAALDEIAVNRGRLYNTDVVDSCVRILGSRFRFD